MIIYIILSFLPSGEPQDYPAALCKYQTDEIDDSVI